MNIDLKYKYLAIYLLLLCGGCIAQNRIAQFTDSNCSMIHKGEIDYGQILNNDAQANSAYINCAIGVRISEPESIEVGSKKHPPPNITKFAEHFLQKIDPSFRDAYGNSLLSVVVISFTPLDWKLKTAEQLIDSGVDIHSKNVFDKTALDLAKSGDEPELTKLMELLVEASKDKRPSPKD